MNSKTINNRRHHKRLCAEKRFRLYGQCAILIAVLLLVVLIGSLVSRGYTGFLQTQIQLPISFGAEPVSKDQPPSAYRRLALQSIKSLFPEVTDPKAVHELENLVSNNSGTAIKSVLDNSPGLISQPINIWVPASSNADLFSKGKISEKTPEMERSISNEQIAWLKQLQEKHLIRTVFNTAFFTRGDSRTPESAGFLGAILGSLLTLAVCLVIVFPLGVLTAVYLQEFARRSRWVDFIEVNINNLAAVPSIVFGLLGLAVYINWWGLPRSVPLVGGMTLALMVLPIIIITTRTALSAIPGSIRDAARALGATPMQVVWHHTFPLAMPGIMTGTILGMARAIGETAPLLMIGMVAFVADLPTGFTSSATVMPVQIYLWASSAEAGYVEKTAAGILVLLMLLLLMNAGAIVLRKKFEVRW